MPMIDTTVPAARYLLADTASKGVAKAKWGDEIGQNFGQLWLAELTEEDITFFPESWSGRGFFSLFLPHGGEVDVYEDAADLARTLIHRVEDEEWDLDDPDCVPHQRTVTAVVLSEKSYWYARTSSWLDALRDRLHELGFPPLELWVLRDSGNLELC